MLVNIQNTLNAIQNIVGDIQNRVIGLENTYVCTFNLSSHLAHSSSYSVTLQPMRIANALASNQAPLVYPPGTAADVLAQLPQLKLDALTITGTRSIFPYLPFLDCLPGVAAHNALLLLGINPVGGNAVAFRAQLHHFLGV
jgi:hypothetical protein